MIGLVDFKLSTLKEPLNAEVLLSFLSFFFQFLGANCHAPVDTLQSDFALRPLLQPPRHTHTDLPDQHPDGADTHIHVVSSCLYTSSFLTNVGANHVDGDVEDDAALC